MGGVGVWIGIGEGKAEGKEKGKIRAGEVEGNMREVGRKRDLVGNNKKEDGDGDGDFPGLGLNAY
jgi:hypothetical protein